MPQHVLVLKGKHAGKNKVLNGTKFIAGEHAIQGTLQDNEGLITYFQKCYQAELRVVDATASKEKTNEGQQENGEQQGQGDQNGGENKTDEEGEVNERLLAAVMSLDPEDDTHWIQSGKPAIEAVVKAYGSEGVKRGDIEVVAPGYDREAAKAAKAAKAAE